MRENAKPNLMFPKTKGYKVIRDYEYCSFLESCKTVQQVVDLVGGGAWTTKVVTFQKFCMSKRKNLDPWGACAGHAP